jgi:hypothetical protein
MHPVHRPGAYPCPIHQAIGWHGYFFFRIIAKPWVTVLQCLPPLREAAYLIDNASKAARQACFIPPPANITEATLGSRVSPKYTSSCTDYGNGYYLHIAEHSCNPFAATSFLDSYASGDSKPEYVEPICQEQHWV